ncbi:MAG: 30S ribosomal protein S6 [Melioribacteraceae bacterium]|nr:30S ribosomal protein S6 [Melioribacteraceae bacterium]
MKTNHYESVIILNATLEDSQVDSILASLEEQMSANGVEITDIEKLGRKRLAYQIQKGKSGYYVIYRFTSPREYITKFERALRLDENIIRFLTIKLERKDLEFIAKKKAEKAEEAEKVEEAKTAEKDDKVETETAAELDDKVETETIVETDENEETKTVVETDTKAETTEEESKESNE